MSSQETLPIGFHNHPLIEIINEEVTELPEGITVIATGPLTSPALAEQVRKLTGEDYLYFSTMQRHQSLKKIQSIWTRSF